MKLKIFYNPKQSANKNDSFSPSATKPAKNINFLLELKLPIEICDFKPLTIEEICLAHDPAYVNDVMELRLNNGFSNKLPEVRDSLPFTTGSFVAAALHAFKNRDPAFSPTSGFHHAKYASARAYCTFEGHAIATVILIQQGAKKVGILDCDMHSPQTMEVLKHIGVAEFVHHYAFGDSMISPGTAKQWLESLPVIVSSFKDCDVILYQAGADPFILDSLGGVLTKEQLYQRDKIVFETTKQIGVPVCWNNAGGYSEPFQHVLDIHANTAIAACEVYGYFDAVCELPVRSWIDSMPEPKSAGEGASEKHQA